MRDKIRSYLGFAQKARKVVLGYDNISAKKRKYNLILVCETASDRLKKNISIYADEKIPYFIVENLEDLTNRKGCKAIAICEPNLASAIIEQLRGRV